MAEAWQGRSGPARVLLDACVLYPTVMRQMLLAAAAQGLFRPLWSDRLLEEWARAAARHGPVDELQARGEIALLRTAWPAACVAPHPGLLARLWLPDPDDIHVLAAAVAGHAELIVTTNAKDFPRNLLAEQGLARLDPDQFLRALWQAHPAAVARAATLVQTRAADHGLPMELRALLKKAHLPRLAKALTA